MNTTIPRRLLLVSLFLLLLTIQAWSRQSYHRIVSLVPSVTQSIYQLNGQERLVGCTSYCKDGVADGKPVVSTAVKMNVEKIVELKPDIVIASGLINPKDVETLRKFGIQVTTMSSPIALEEIYNQFLTIGEYLDARDRAGQIVARTRMAVQEIRNRHAQENGRIRVFFQIGADPIFAVLKGTFMDSYITILGGENVTSGLQNGTVGREYILAQDPDYIFIATMGIVGENEVKAWNRHQNLKATKGKHIYVVNSEIACQPTPETFLQTLREMDRLIK